MLYQNKLGWRDALIIAPFLVLYTALIYWSRNFAFFWDVVLQGSIHAHLITDTGFSSWFLPAAYDPGYPPFFGFYLSIIWGLFGQTLPASHFSILPFVIMLLITVYIFCCHFLPEFWYRILAMLIISSDPVLLSQVVIISPDILLVSFFFLSLLLVFRQKWWLFVFSSILLVIAHSRGLFLLAAILIFHLINSGKPLLSKQKIKIIVPYLPAFLGFALQYLLHYKITGHIFPNEQSGWSQNFNPNNVTGLLRDIGVVGWRYLDFGRIVVWLVIFLILFKRRINISSDKRQLNILLLFLASTFFSLILPVYYTMPELHRYFLTGYILLSVYLVYLLANYVRNKWYKVIITLIVLLSLWTGNLWVYPDGIAQGWDSSLAHVPFYSLRKESNSWLNKQSIDIREVGTRMPFGSKGKYTDLNGIDYGMHYARLDSSRYILLSNMTNDFTDEEVSILRQRWKQMWRKERNRVWIEIYANPNCTKH